jgi:hypothetical protein
MVHASDAELDNDNAWARMQFTFKDKDGEVLLVFRMDLSEWRVRSTPFTDRYFNDIP